MKKTVKDHFEKEATQFDEIIIKLIPFYEEMLEAAVSSIPFKNNKAVNVIDIGCGTGNAAGKIKARYPLSGIHCIDITENMILAARKKLEKLEKISFEIADIETYDFNLKYDVALSSLAIHHLENDEDKYNLFKRIFNCLLSGGVFYVFDIILAPSDYLQKVYMQKWKDFMGLSISDSEIESVWMKKYKDEDRPCELTKQIKWLQDIGFKEVEVIMKYYNFAVYGGRKQ